MLKPLIAALAITLAPQLAWSTAQVKLTPSQTSVMVGDSFSVLVQGVGFDKTPTNAVIDNFQGGQNVAFTFNNAALELLSVTVDTAWTFRRLPGTINNTAGTLKSLTFLASPALVTTGPDYSFNFATLQFKALAPGTGSVLATGGSFVGKVAGAAAKSINPTLGSTSVMVTSVVPEPGSAALLLAGMGVVGLLMRRRAAGRLGC